MLRRLPTTAAAAVVTLLLVTAMADPNDELCLTSLHQSLHDPSNSLQNWTKSSFSNPCNGSSAVLLGVTCNNGRIYRLTLPNLSLSGTISPFISNCTNLQSLDLSSNSISGTIPLDLHYLINLAFLNLSSNSLSGSIPLQLVQCLYLNVIDLHSNRLYGSIPQQLGLLARLRIFDVSNNRLSGMIPANLVRFNVDSFRGNKDLYGYPLQGMNSRGLSVMAIVGIGLGSGFVSLILSFCGVCVWLRISEKKMENEESKINQSMPQY